MYSIRDVLLLDRGFIALRMSYFENRVNENSSLEYYTFL